MDPVSSYLGHIICMLWEELLHSCISIRIEDYIYPIFSLARETEAILRASRGLPACASCHPKPGTFYYSSLTIESCALILMSKIGIEHDHS